MGELSNIEEDVLKKYPKAIVHMRSRFDNGNGRFGLVLGSGVSKPFKIPNWKNLVKRIANDPEVRADHLIRKNAERDSQAVLTQVLFQHFKAQQYEEADPVTHHTVELEGDINHKWRDIIRRNLYRSAKVDGNLSDKHPYIGEYLEIIQKTNLTVNYNFDDVIERMLSARRSAEESERERGYETVWNPHQQFARRNAIIYHPNGFLPENPLEPLSEELVFSEDAYADQLIDTMTGHYATLLHHLSKYTCLFLGLSLEDSTLRHLLRQNARLNPGHYHYYVSFAEKSRNVNQARRKAVTEANFEIYNLITLFLNEEEIKALGRLITLDHQELEHAAEELGVKILYCYYLTGTICVGKSTTLAYFKSLGTFDEWFEPRLTLLGKPANELTQEQKEEVDAWLARQFALKNRELLDKKEGIYVIDRCPLDPVSFTEPQEWKDKADHLVNAISLRMAGKKIRPGYVILLQGDEKELAVRAKNRNKEASPEYIAKIQSKLQKIYEDMNLTVVNTSGGYVDKIVRRVAHLIYMEDYKEIDLHSKLLRIKTGEIKCMT